MEAEKKTPAMTSDVADIATKMLVVINNERWQARYIAIERYEKNGPQWVHLVVEKGNQSHIYLIDRKKMVNAWLHLVKGQVQLAGMVVSVDGVQWEPLNAAIDDVCDVRSVTLSLKSPEGITQMISIDFDGLVAAYYALRTNINDLFDVMSEITQTLINFGNG